MKVCSSRRASVISNSPTSVGPAVGPNEENYTLVIPESQVA